MQSCVQWNPVGKISASRDPRASRWPPLEMAVYLAVAGDVFDDVFFVLSFFPRDVLDEI